MFSNCNTTHEKTLGIRFTKVTKSNCSEYLPARIYVTPFSFQYFTENHNSSLKFSETESSVSFGSPVLEDFTSV